MINKALIVFALVLTACGSATSDVSSTLATATEEEMKVFCARYEEVKDQAEKWRELEKVAPEEIKGVLFRLANGPSDGVWEDLEAAQEFERRCLDNS